MEKMQEIKKKILSQYDVTKRQLSSICRIMDCFKIPIEAAVIEVTLREDFKAKRDKKLEKIFGIGVNNDYKISSITKKVE